MMNNKVESLLSSHINRIQRNITDRDNSTFSNGTPRNVLDADLNKIDRKNIASLREGRVPQYQDHMDCLLGDDIPMSEFADVTQELREINSLLNTEEKG